MKTPLVLSLAVTLALSGCATTGGMSPFGSKSKEPVTTEQKAEARRGALRDAGKGCAVGAATTVGIAVLGRILGFGGGIDARTAVAGCVVSGTAVGIQSYNQQLNDFRALQGKVTVGAVVKVDEKTVQAEGKTTTAASLMTLELDAAKVTAKHRDIQAVVDELAKTLNKQAMPITVSIRGSSVDRDWLAGQLKDQLTNEQITVNEVAGVAPVILVSPMPEAK